MPYFVYGTDPTTGAVRPRLFSTATNEADARAHGADHGMAVTAVVPCRASDRPPDPAIAHAHVRSAAAKEPQARGTVAGAASRVALKSRGAPTVTAADSEEVAAFNRTLDDLTPSTFVCGTIVGLNLLVYVVMALSGVGWVNPSAADLVKWGAEYGPRTLDGEGWRLFTAMFVHVGLTHVAYNMLALAYVGAVMERLLGNAGFALVYVVAGVGGGIAALLSDPFVVHAGASGAVFGVYGALAAQLMRQGRSMPPHVARVLGRLAGIFVVYNLAYSITPGVSLAAHLGGLVTGFACGLVLADTVSRDALHARPVRAGAVAAIGVALAIGGIALAQSRFAGLDRLVAMQDRIVRLDRQDAKAFDGVAYTSDRGGLADDAFADHVERDVLPPWRALRAELDAMGAVAPAFAGRAIALGEYMRLRQESCELIVSGLRDHRKTDVDAAKTARSHAREVWRGLR